MIPAPYGMTEAVAKLSGSHAKHNGFYIDKLKDATRQVRNWVERYMKGHEW